VRAAAAAGLAVLALVSAGCGSDTGRVVGADADRAHGKQLFSEKCAACHTLRDAKAVGTIGPNLDASFAPDRAQGFEESTFLQVVYDQIKYPGNYGENGPTMPENLVTGDDVEDVAAYVAYVAGSPKNSVTASAPPATTTTPESGGGGGGGAASAAGKKAFTDNGCSSCHTLAAAGATGKIGPDLDKLKTYAADADKPLDDFIHESIVAPNDYVEKGYPKGVMPSFASLPQETLDALVAFLAASAK
jgi:mono/diheme cytochrome c family protein